MSSSERKTIQINPELFKLQHNKTRRKQPKKDIDKQIRIKSPKSEKKTSTLKKNILNMIRNHQEERLKSKSKPSSNPILSDSTSFKNDFKESFEYLSSLTKDVKQKQENKNQTIRHYPTKNPYESCSSYDIPIHMNHFPSEDVSEIIHTPEGNYIRLTSKTTHLPPPKYGCLKNGKLPTYRNWQNQTRKHHDIDVQDVSVMHLNSGNPPLIEKPNKINLASLPSTEIISKLETNIKELSRIQQIKNKIRPLKKGSSLIRCPRQKKTIRRMYYVGKSKSHPRISVLVSNKTIRSNTTLKAQQLKQTPITEVKKYLLKNGFIKIGTNAPNDVLRQMYENTKMICGEVKNHNPENLLYNYFNDPLNTM